VAKKIEVDPFFDGETRVNAEQPVPVPANIPAGPAGLAGTVIPPAAAGNAGAPSNWTGSENVRTEIHVDPDIPGQSFVVNTEDLNKENIAQAISAVSAEDPRIRASAVYNAVASRKEGASVSTAQSSLHGEENLEAHVVHPLKAFESTEDRSPVSRVENILPTASAAPPPPKEWVTFEIEGFGEHKAPYHRVIRNNSTLVLVYDTSCAGSQKFFPRATEKPMGVHVEGSSVAYYAHTTGIEFSDGSTEFCILLIEQEAPVNED
jgi:hypothetical protein